MNKLINATLGSCDDIRNIVVDAESRDLIGVYQEPATPLPAHDHHDPPDTPPPTSFRSHEFATPQKPPASSSHGSYRSSQPSPVASSSAPGLMKPPSFHGALHTNPRTLPNRPNGLLKAPGPGPGGGGGGHHYPPLSSSSSLAPISNSQRHRPAAGGRQQVPKLAFNPASTPQIEGRGVDYILKEMQSVAVPLTAIAATPRKECGADQPRFDFTLPLQKTSSSVHPQQQQQQHRKGAADFSLITDLDVSDSDQDSDADQVSAPAVLSPLPHDPPPVSASSAPSAAVQSILRTMSPPVTVAPLTPLEHDSTSSEGEGSDDDSSSSSASESSSDSELEAKNVSPNPKVLVSISLITI